MTKRKHWALITWLVFHLKISGIDDNDWQPLNISFILVILFIFHLDISDKNNNDLQLLNIPLISVTLLVFHFDISGNDVKNEQNEKRLL